MNREKFLNCFGRVKSSKCRNESSGSERDKVFQTALMIDHDGVKSAVFTRGDEVDQREDNGDSMSIENTEIAPINEQRKREKRTFSSCTRKALKCLKSPLKKKQRLHNDSGSDETLHSGWSSSAALIPMDFEHCSISSPSPRGKSPREWSTAKEPQVSTARCARTTLKFNNDLSDCQKLSNCEGSSKMKRRGDCFNPSQPEAKCRRQQSDSEIPVKSSDRTSDETSCEKSSIFEKMSQLQGQSSTSHVSGTINDPDDRFISSSGKEFSSINEAPSSEPSTSSQVPADSLEEGAKTKSSPISFDKSFDRVGTCLRKLSHYSSAPELYSDANDCSFGLDCREELDFFCSLDDFSGASMIRVKNDESFPIHDDDTVFYIDEEAPSSRRYSCANDDISAFIANNSSYVFATYV